MMQMLNTGLRSLRSVFRFLLFAAWVALITPWVVASVVRAGVQRLARALHVILAVPRAASDVLPCPRGHASELLGVFECRGCGGLFAGHAFQRCPICRSTAGHVMCEHCGLTIRNPMMG